MYHKLGDIVVVYFVVIINIIFIIVYIILVTINSMLFLTGKREFIKQQKEIQISKPTKITEFRYPFVIRSCHKWLLSLRTAFNNGS